jgi:hypothetical protein
MELYINIQFDKLLVKLLYAGTEMSQTEIQSIKFVGNLGTVQCSR